MAGRRKSKTELPENAMILKEIPPEVGVGYTAPGAYSFLTYLVKTAPNLPAYYCQERDLFLRREVIKNEFLNSAVWVVLLKLYGLPFKVQSRDATVGAHLKLAETYNDILQMSLNQYYEQFIYDTIVCDNGGIFFVDGFEPSDQPLQSAATGIKHLDSVHCQRTGDETHPIIYYHSNGSIYKLHESRIISLVQMKSPDRDLHGVGLSFVTRCFLLAQHLLDVSQYEAESLGSRSSEEIIYATGATSNNIKDAFVTADLDSDNAGLLRVGKRVYLGLRDPSAKVGKLMLKNLPDNFNKRDDVEITLTLLAMASGGQSTWFYDSVKSGSTKASAAESTKIGESKIITWWLDKFSRELEAKFLPPFLMITSGYDDIDYDGTKSTIRKTAAETRDINLKNHTTNLRIERELQVQRGELSQQQFELLELEDGRLPNGLPIYAIFQTTDSAIRKLIYVVPEPLNYEKNSPETIIPLIETNKNLAISMSLNGKTILTQQQGRLSMYALQWLQEQYQRPPQDTIETDATIPLRGTVPTAQTPAIAAQGAAQAQVANYAAKLNSENSSANSIKPTTLPQSSSSMVNSATSPDNLQGN